MPLSADNVIQDNSGTGVTVTLPSGTTAGNTVVVIFVATAGITPATGFANDVNAGTTAIQVHSKSDVSASETSWSFSVASGSVSWYATELSNVDPVLPLDASAASAAGVAVSNGGTLATGITPLNAGLSTVQFAIWAVPVSSGVSWSGYTNGFTETVDLGTAPALAVARSFTDGSTGTFSSTATLASSGSVNVTALVVAYRAADAPIVAPLSLLAGFDWGTHGGVTASSGDSSLLGASLSGASGTFGTNYLIQAGSARTSAYGLRIVQSGAAAYVRMGNLNAAKAAAVGLNVRVVSATGTVVVASLTGNAGSGIYAQILYDATNSKFGVQAGAAGTASWQSGTTAANTWVWIDLRTRVNVTTWQVDWRIETAANTYTDQTAATLAGQSAAGTIYNLVPGLSTAQTMTADYDDIVISRYFGAYPLGPHEVRCLTVDPAGTPTVTTSSLFSTFASNGTLTAWNATAARDALDEVPPTVSAAADGVVQTAVGATDYMQFPMADYALGPTEFVNGVRMLAPIWSGTGAGAGDIAIRGYDGTTETALATVSQLTPGSPTAISATLPLWRTAMWQSTNGWTQAELNACALRVGFSGDATPDMGVSALYLEVAIGRTRTRQLFGDFATVEEDPTRLGVMSITVTAPSGGDSTLYYEDNTVPSTVPVATETSVTQQIDSETAADANYIAFYPPPEGVPDA